MTQLSLSEVFPRARDTDPDTSHAAARAVQPGNSALVCAIRAVVRSYGPMTQFSIARVVEREHPDHWSEPTIRTACARAGLTRLNMWERSPRGHRAYLFDLGLETVKTTGEVL
jgi:hypothetical protein